ncbi:MAG TPA: hypothetical protein VGH23_15825 [Rhizomicrobium sp.]|jgi:hypothetical protein
MSKIRAILFCGLFMIPAVASAEDLAPVALNSLSVAPANVVGLPVLDQKGETIGKALRMVSDQDGHPAALAFRANNGTTVVISAGATSYDGHALVTSNDQPQIAALSAVRTATK